VMASAAVAHPSPHTLTAFSIPRPVIGPFLPVLFCQISAYIVHLPSLVMNTYSLWCEPLNLSRKVNFFKKVRIHSSRTYVQA
jgi:hypothetical protein